MGGYIWRGAQLPRTADDLVMRTLATADRVPDRPALIDARDETVTTYGACSLPMRLALISSIDAASGSAV